MVGGSGKGSENGIIPLIYVLILSLRRGVHKKPKHPYVMVPYLCCQGKLWRHLWIPKNFPLDIVKAFKISWNIDHFDILKGKNLYGFSDMFSLVIIAQLLLAWTWWTRIQRKRIFSIYWPQKFEKILSPSNNFLTFTFHWMRERCI